MNLFKTIVSAFWHCFQLPFHWAEHYKQMIVNKCPCFYNGSRSTCFTSGCLFVMTSSILSTSSPILLTICSPWWHIKRRRLSSSEILRNSCKRIHRFYLNKIKHTKTKISASQYFHHLKMDLNGRTIIWYEFETSISDASKSPAKLNLYLHQL